MHPSRFADAAGAPLAAVLGVCGGVAAGKSSACRFLASLDARVVHVDADALGHAAYAPGGPAHARVAALFPSAVRAGDASIDRAALGRLVFGDAAARAALQAAVWPAVAQLAREALSARAAAAAAADVAGTTTAAATMRASPAIGVLEAALLFEAGWARACDAVWLVRAPRAAALARVRARANAPADDAAVAAIVDAQPTADVRAAAAAADGTPFDAVVDTDRDAAETQAALTADWDAFLARCGLPPRPA
jgi:dephospho-CoA kinase